MRTLMQCNKEPVIQATILLDVVVTFTMPQGGGDPYVGSFEITEGMVVSPDGKYRQSLKELSDGHAIRDCRTGRALFLV